MNALLSLVVFTANILGSFNDPFEFDGNYGEELNPIREYVFEQVVSKETLASNLADAEIAHLIGDKNPSAEEIGRYRQTLVVNACQLDREHGPALQDLVSPDLI